MRTTTTIDTTETRHPAPFSKSKRGHERRQERRRRAAEKSGL